MQSDLSVHGEWGNFSTQQIGRGLKMCYQQNCCIGPGGKAPTRRSSLLCHIKNVQQNAYFYSLRHHEGCSLIVHKKSLGYLRPEGTESEGLKGWILKFREDSKRLYTIVETFVKWIANKIPPWAAYCAFMSCRIIALDKNLDVRLVRVRETWKHIFNIVLKVTGKESTMACQDHHMCAVLKSGIYGTFHGFQAI